MAGECVWQGGHVWHTCPPPMNRMRDVCQNITLPQTSFAGGIQNPEYILFSKGYYLLTMFSCRYSHFFNLKLILQVNLPPGTRICIGMRKFVLIMKTTISSIYRISGDMLLVS